MTGAEKRTSAGLRWLQGLGGQVLRPSWVRGREGAGKEEDGPWGCLVWVGRTRTKIEKNIIEWLFGETGVILRW